MAGWDQAVGPALLRDDADDLTPLTNEAADQFLTSDTDGAGFEASGLAKIAVAAAFSQDATWAASATETDTSTAGWSQDATWDAVAQSAEPVTAEATFDQAAASWLASEAELIAGTASFDQDAASWGAEVSVTDGGEEPPVAIPSGGSRWRRTSVPVAVVAEPDFSEDDAMLVLL